MSSRARRPYLMGKKSLVEFYQAPVRYLKEVLGRESEFEKPYVDEEYNPLLLHSPPKYTMYSQYLVHTKSQDDTI